MVVIVKADYNSSQSDLYSVIEIAWGNFDLRQPEMAAFKSKYTTAYSTQAKNELRSAMTMADVQARGEEAETLLGILKTQGAACRLTFRKLESYIEEAYPDPTEMKAKTEAAGSSYFAAAGQEDWGSLKLLNLSAKTFVDGHLTKLKDDGFMPDDFRDEVSNNGDAFALTHKAFLLAEQTNEATVAKLTANNAIFHKTMGMLKDAQLVFDANQETKMRFVFQHLLTLVNPPVSGIKGSVVFKESNAPGVGAVITVEKDGVGVQRVIVDENAEFSVRLEGDVSYTVICTCEGRVTQTRVINVVKGSYKMLEFVMVAG